MARKKYRDRLIHLNDIEEEIRLIEGSFTDYVSKNGNIYKEYETDLFIKKKTRMNEYNGYVYCSITMIDKNISKRVHRLVAQVFLDNKDNLSIVGHKNNIKSDNRAGNLYWTTTSENTKKAFDDGLIKNDMGYEDSQSFPVDVFDLNGNKIASYGSITICQNSLGVSKSTISKQCKGVTKGKPRCGYIFKYQ